MNSERWGTSSEFALRILDPADADSAAVLGLAEEFWEARFSEHVVTEEARARADAFLTRMSGVDGVTAIRLIRAVPDGPPMLVLTTFEDEEGLAGALRAGAAGFLLKGVPAEDPQRAVREVADGGAWLTRR